MALGDLARVVQQREEYISKLEAENARLRRKANRLLGRLKRWKARPKPCTIVRA